MNKDISGLPKWAQQRIETAEADAAYWKARALGTRNETDTGIRYLEELRYLPPETRVEFGIVHRDYPTGFRSHRGLGAYWDANRQHLDISGDDPIAVHPLASNHVQIVRRDRHS